MIGRSPISVHSLIIECGSSLGQNLPDRAEEGADSATPPLSGDARWGPIEDRGSSEEHVPIASDLSAFASWSGRIRSS
jgi:hypothetical protein